jgi:hypothetical protein
LFLHSQKSVFLGIGFLLAKLQNISELPASFGEKILQKIVNTRWLGKQETEVIAASAFSCGYLSVS